MRKLSLVLSLLVVGLVSGCGTAGGPAILTVAVNVTSNPSTTNGVQVSAQVQFTATVTNDSQNQGVTWTITGASCSGAGNPCGTLLATSTPSGTPTTYTAPANPPAPNASVTVTATSVTDPTKSVQATFTIIAISVQITSPSPLPTGVQVNTQVQFTATVTNDLQNKGVSWTVTGVSCAGTACGSVSPTSTASGTATTYTAPGSVPSPNTLVTVTATSVTDNTRIAQVTFTISTGPPISVQITSPNPKPSSVQANTTVQFTATVTNDPQNKGVNWTVTGPSCAGVTCGTVAPNSTASGTATTYTAPGSPPVPNNSVTVTATSAADNFTKDSATFNIVTNNPSNTELNGHYVFTFSGFDNNGNAVVRGGVFIADGNGNIAGGVQDSNNAATGPSKNQTISGTYNVGSDNRGTMTLGGVGYRFALGRIISGAATRGHFVEFDINTSTGVGIEGSGEFKLQDATLIPFSLSEIASDFAFGASGTDSSGKRFGVVGRMTISSGGAASNEAIDISSPGLNGNLGLTGSFSDPNNTLASFGRLLAALTPTGQTADNFAFYIVSSTELFFVDVDDTSNKTALFTGAARKQIIPSGGFTNASANGNAIFNVTGADADVAGGADVTIGQLSADGMTDANGQGNLSGILDQNEGGTISTGIPFTGKYSIAPNGRGTLTFVINATTSKPFTFYVVDTNAAFLLEGTPTTPGSDVQQGFVEPQATGPFDDSTIAGNWAAGTGAPPVPNAHNSSGVFTLDGTLDAFNGTIDETKFSSPFEIPDEAITGSYATTAVGRASVTITSGGGSNGVIWIVSANRFVLLVSTNTGDKKPSAIIADRQ